MARGNKFKPKPQQQPEAEPVPEPVLQPGVAPAAAEAGEQRRKKKAKRKGEQPQQQAQQQQAEPSGAKQQQQSAGPKEEAQDSRGRQPPKKKQKLAAGGRGVAAAQPPAPIIPTLVVPAPPKCATAAGVGSNWAALKSALAQQQQQQQQQQQSKPKRRRGPPPGKQRGKGAAEGGEDDPTQDAKPGGKVPQSLGSDQGLTKVLAIDCEMVGVGPGGSRSVVARVCIVNSAGNVVLDTYVKPTEQVTDYRTKVSGVRPAHLQGAPDFDSVQKRVGDALRGRVVVGHAIANDLKVLLLGHPRKDVRDTSRYPPFMQTQGRKLRPRALRHLAAEQLGLSIQGGEHNPVDDARAALYLYLKHRKEWERWLAQGGKPPRQEPLHAGGARKQPPLKPHAPRERYAPRMLQTLEQLAKNDYMADL